jgi:hypothetical protein
MGSARTVWKKFISGAKSLVLRNVLGVILKWQGNDFWPIGPKKSDALKLYTPVDS